MDFILTESPSTLANKRDSVYLMERMNETDITMSLMKDIDFLNIILPSSSEEINTPELDDDEISSSAYIVKELLKFHETGVVKQTSTKATNTDDVLIDSKISQTNTNENSEDEVIYIRMDSSDVKSTKITSKKKTSGPENESRNKTKSKRTSKRSLTFPPCVICSGKSTGLHYGAITCEACKGFFRRHLQKKTDFKCNKGGNCEILASKKGPCSGCRLKKCLGLGMAKERSKIGRYTLTKRTEAIIRMNTSDKKSENDKVTIENSVLSVGMDLDRDIIPEFDDELVGKLVHVMDEIEPYGPNIKTKEQLHECHKRIYESYKRKVELFGNMGSIPKEEFMKLYKDFGIDVDGRIQDMKIEFSDFEMYVNRYENFAKQIPGFSELHDEDQTSLLKVAMSDFSIVIDYNGYNKEYNTFVSTDGHGYHFEEMVNKFYSLKLMELIVDIYCRWQDLCLSEEETALIGALTLVSADRCKLQNRALVEKMQLMLIEQLRLYIKKTKHHEYLRRFVKIMDTLTKTREMSELFMKEQNEISKDEVMLQEVPFIGYLFVEDTY